MEIQKNQKNTEDKQNGIIRYPQNNGEIEKISTYNVRIIIYDANF